MRVKSIRVDHFRQLRAISIVVPDETRLVCLVGTNGTGKSTILEVIAMASQHVGIAPGYEPWRPKGGQVEEDWEVVFDVSDIRDDFFSNYDESTKSMYEAWNSEVIVSSATNLDATGKVESHRRSTIAGGLTNVNEAHNLGAQICNWFQHRLATHYLLLDADRSYYEVPVNSNVFADSISRDWKSPAWQKNQAYKPTRSLYDDWIYYMLSREQQSAIEVQKNAREAGRYPEGPVQDPFREYGEALRTVLPHLRFYGVEAIERTVLFALGDHKLTFRQLSGGEREVAFILSQIDRFQLKQGLLLVDEPELHLNSELQRTWLSYLRDTVNQGQVWIGTHSLEAVEVAGLESSFLLLRSPGDNLVTSAASLDSVPNLTTLSMELGTPAFSIENTAFVYVEGEPGGDERQRFKNLSTELPATKFIPSGGGRDVLQKLAGGEALAAEATQPVRVGGIVDRDHKTQQEIDQMRATTNVHVLPVHEIENLFLHPKTMNHLAGTLGHTQTWFDGKLLELADRRAGNWILERGRIRSGLNVGASGAYREYAHRLTWQEVEADEEGAISATLQRLPFLTDPAQIQQLTAHFRLAVDEYRALRASPALWSEVSGKEVCRNLLAPLGLTSMERLESSVLQHWLAHPTDRPAELLAMLAFIEGL